MVTWDISDLIYASLKWVYGMSCVRKKIATWHLCKKSGWRCFARAVSVRLSALLLKSTLKFTAVVWSPYSPTRFVWHFHMHSQELSKIAMPVVFNEPLSFLQRMSEYMEHTHLIHKACSLSDSIDRMQVCLNGPGAMFGQYCWSILFKVMFVAWKATELSYYGLIHLTGLLTVCCCICCFGCCISMGKDWKAI